MDKYKEISLKDINLKDSTFSFSFPQELDSLTESIRKIGLIQPPILFKNRIVCGRRRVLSCRKLGLKKIKAIIIEKPCAQEELFNLNLEDNLSTRELNIIEKSKILNKLQKDAAIKKYLPLLKVSPFAIWLDNLPDDIKKLIIERKVSFNTLNITKDWPSKKRNKILKYVLSLGFGDNKTSEILQTIGDTPCKSMTGKELREYLLQRQSPIHTEFKNKVKRIVSRLNLPENVSIDLKDLLTWEYNYINLRIKCKTKEDLKKAIEKLNSLNSSKELDELLALLSAV